MAVLTVKQLNEISLVPAGANPLADVLVTKETGKDSALTRFMAAVRKAFAAKEPTEVEKALGEAEAALASTDATDGDGNDTGGATAQREQALKALGDVLDEITRMCGDCKPGKPCKKHAKEYKDAMELVGKDASSVSEVLGRQKMYATVEALNQSIWSILYDEEIADKGKALTQTFRQFQAAALDALGTPLNAETDPMADETKTEKGIPEHVQKQIDALTAAQKAADERAEKAEAAVKLADERVAKIEKDREREIAKTAVKAALGKVSMDVEKATDLYLSLSAEHRTLMVDSWKAQNAALETSDLFTEKGRRGEAEPDSAEGKIEAEAAKLVAANPKLTKEAAYAAVLDRTEFGTMLYAERVGAEA